MQNLNSSQKKAVEHQEGPCMVLAGPGAGKTRVLSHRVAYLINQKGLSPSQLLVLTFTKKAAAEMKKRIQAEVQLPLNTLWVGTFHSIFMRILRNESKAVELNKDFIIYGPEESGHLVKILLKSLELDPKKYPIRKVLQRISLAKKSGIDAKNYAKFPEWQSEDRRAGMPHFFALYRHHQGRLEAASAIDFDDILLKTKHLFSTNKEILAHYQERFPYVLVDEFQDTNDLQYAIIKALAGHKKNLFIVGDDAQSIYAFQGAKMEHMLHFKEHFPSAQIIKLEENYRSTPQIVATANRLIRHNRQHPKNLFTQNPLGDSIQIIATLNDLDEARFVAEDIAKRLKREEATPSDFAILFRFNRQAHPLESALRKCGIPYQLIGGLSFYGRKEIKDLIAYLRMIVNPSDEEALFRSLSAPKRGIGPISLQKAQDYAQSNNCTLWIALLNIEKWSKANLIKKIHAYTSTIKNAKESLDKGGDMAQVVRQLLHESGLSALFQEEAKKEEAKGIIGPDRVAHFDAFIDTIEDFKEKNPAGTLGVFLQELALIDGVEEEREDAPEKVSLITVHKAKGLEWPHLYGIGMVEEIFPSFQATSPEEIEEERRLAFVAITRAKKSLTLTYFKHRLLHGQFFEAKPSRFLKEIDQEGRIKEKDRSHQKKDFFHKTSAPLDGKKNVHYSLSSKKKSKMPIEKFRKLRALSHPSQNQTKKEDLPENKIKIGIRVLHRTFGRGTISAIDHKGKHPKITIDFDEKGKKTLLLGYAKLKALGIE